MEPENCNDFNITCSYQRLPSFDALKHAYLEAPKYVTTKDRFNPPRRRRKKSICPKKFPALDSINWTVVDGTYNLVCLPPVSENLNKHPSPSQGTNSAGSSNLVFGLLVFAMLVATIKTAIRNRHFMETAAEDDIDRLTIGHSENEKVHITVGNSDDEFVGLLSLKLNYHVKSAEDGGEYSTLDSDSSGNDVA